jgi:hypothetical protein
MDLAPNASRYGSGSFRKRSSQRNLRRPVKETKKEPTSAAFVARCASGGQQNPIAGTARTATTRKTFMTVAARHGTLSPRVVAARAATINGVGRFACAVSAGRTIWIGTKNRTAYAGSKKALLASAHICFEFRVSRFELTPKPGTRNPKPRKRVKFSVSPNPSTPRANNCDRRIFRARAMAPLHRFVRRRCGCCI